MTESIPAGGPEGRGGGFPPEFELSRRLFPPEPGGIQWGLDRTRKLLAACGNPHLGIPVLHVGGTNGKGSVAWLWDGVLSAEGHRVGLYTSPHLQSLGERFRVGGHPLATELLVEAAGELRPLFERFRPSHFEAETVLAFELFRREQVSMVVAEVGLGGRLDATNVVEPSVTAITNVGLDHGQYLGRTLAEVAWEKAGILKQGVPAVLGETRPRIRALFQKWARERHVPLQMVERRLRGAQVSRRGTEVKVLTDSFGPLHVSTPLLGAHQARNMAVAVRGLDLLPSVLRPSRQSVVEGVRGVRVPGRMEVAEAKGGGWLLDVAHNPAGARALARTLAALDFPRPRVLVAGILADKDGAGILRPLLRAVDEAILTSPPGAPPHRRWDPDSVAGTLSGSKPLEVRRDLREALQVSRSRAGGGGTVVVSGSFHTVGAARSWLGLRDA